MTTGAASRSNCNLSQSGDGVEQVYRNPEVNPYVTSNPFGILVDEGLNSIQDDLNCKFTANVSRLGHSKSGERAPASMVKTDCCRPVYTMGRDVTACGGSQDDANRQAGLADCDPEKVKKNRYLCHSELKKGFGEIDEDLGDKANRTEKGV